MPGTTPLTPRAKVQLAIANCVRGAAAGRVAEGVAEGVALAVREALALAPGTYWPRMKTSSTRNVLVLQMFETIAQQKSGLPLAALGKVTVGAATQFVVSVEELAPKRVKLAPASVLYAHPADVHALVLPIRTFPPQVTLAKPRAEAQKIKVAGLNRE